MKITGGKWTLKVNMLTISCDCGNTIVHPANKWVVKCPNCNRMGNLQELRDDYVSGNETKGVGDG